METASVSNSDIEKGKSVRSEEEELDLDIKQV